MGHSKKCASIEGTWFGTMNLNIPEFFNKNYQFVTAINSNGTWTANSVYDLAPLLDDNDSLPGLTWEGSWKKIGCRRYQFVSLQITSKNLICSSDEGLCPGNLISSGAVFAKLNFEVQLSEDKKTFTTITPGTQKYYNITDNVNTAEPFGNMGAVTFSAEKLLF